MIAALVANRPFRTAAEYNALMQGNPAGSKLRFGGNSIFTIRASARLRIPGTEKLNDMRRAAACVIKLQPAKDPPYIVLRWYDRG